MPVDAGPRRSGVQAVALLPPLRQRGLGKAHMAREMAASLAHAPMDPDCLALDRVEGTILAGQHETCHFQTAADAHGQVPTGDWSPNHCTFRHSRKRSRARYSMT